MMRCVVHGDKQMSFSTVYGWFTKFSSSQKSVKDASYSGRLRSAVTKSNINKIKFIIEKDVRFTIRQHKWQTGLASVHFILKKILKVTKISACWIPHLLTMSRNEQRCKWQSNCWRSTQNIRKRCLVSLITGVETWVQFTESKHKVDNGIWDLKMPSIAKRTLTAKKLYAIFFRNSGPCHSHANCCSYRSVSVSFYKNMFLKLEAQVG